MEIKKMFPSHKLIVGINSHKSIMLNKPDRKKELFSDEDRKFIIESIRYVDEAYLFDEETPLELIKKIKPQILVKGGDYYGKTIIGSNLVETTVLINFTKDYSTKNTLMNINSLDY
jgi:D-beta-D-heptose 7-phosphate kinase/D-beta-D-heptose 1-phosphate adenosyltransferase